MENLPKKYAASAGAPIGARMHHHNGTSDRRYAPARAVGFLLAEYEYAKTNPKNRMSQIFQ